MAVISSHTLNGMDGTHASGIPVALKNLSSGEILFDSFTDEGGRLSEHVDVTGNDPATEYELCFKTGIFWEDRSCGHIVTARIIAFRFIMPVSAARYHIPVVLSPNSFSCWMSVPEDP